MKVSEYLNIGTKNIVEEAPEGYEEIGVAKSGCHVVNIYVKRNNQTIADVKIKATKRCKKLLAISDYVAEKMKESGKLDINEDDILQFFKEEKDIDKMKDRINILKSALGKS